MTDGGLELAPDDGAADEAGGARASDAGLQFDFAIETEEWEARLRPAEAFREA